MLNPVELMDAARASTGLEDFGEDSFLDGLERLCHSLNTEATLNDVGRMALPQLLGKLLANRLKIEDWYARHPEIDDEQIAAPLIGLGLPRTGSTALAALLAEDPNARSLLVWMAGEPAPPPATVEGPDPRIAAVEFSMAMQHELAPRLAQLVPMSPDGPEECQDLMALTFKSHYFLAFAHIPSYADWFLTADLTSTYEYEKRALKLLQWKAPRKPWRLKCPTHLLFLPALNRAFPDARFVWTHRDPTDVMVSVSDVFAEVQGMFADDMDRPYLGALNVEHWTTGMRRALEFRADGNDDRFFDLDFHAVQKDPINEVRRLYEWLGEPVTAEFEAGMARWWKEMAENREHNVHPPAEEFGLDLDAIRPLFADYVASAEKWCAPLGGRADR
ncbi:MAG TPA: sulfotransferase [Mycobacteriales bacterium]|nr:sulfotransferase [Mycobacteriales bacterium]